MIGWFRRRRKRQVTEALVTACYAAAAAAISERNKLMRLKKTHGHLPADQNPLIGPFGEDRLMAAQMRAEICVSMANTYSSHS